MRVSRFNRQSRAACRKSGHSLSRVQHLKPLRFEWLEDRSLLSVAPTGVDLLAGSDTGVFDNDNLTYLDNSSVEKALQFEVSGTVAGATVTLYADGTAIGAAQATGETTTLNSLGTHDLLDGSHSITARQMESGQTESADSPALAVTVDTVDPFQAVPVMKLLAAEGAADDLLGHSVSIDGNTAIVGAYQDDDNGSNSGSAYVFEDTGSGWTQIAKLTASDGAAGDSFGYNVSISGNVALVGAPGDREQDMQCGSAYVFENTGSGWVQVAKLTANDAAGGDTFGYTVSVSGATAVVGASWDDDLGEDSGSAYIFTRTGSGWVQEAKLNASDGIRHSYFGHSVANSGTTIVVGMLYDYSQSPDAGAAYVFEHTDSGWVQAAKLTASDPTSMADFSKSISIHGDVILVGAPGDNDHGLRSGSAYIFKDGGSGWAQVAKLTVSDGATDDYFGCSVSVSGNTAAIGAVGDDDIGSGSGSVYVFQDDGASWTQVAKLTAPNGAAYDYFGRSVSISGGVTIVGAEGDDDLGDSSGSAYLFQTGAQVADDTGSSAGDRATSDTTPELTFRFTEPIYGQDSDVTVRDPNGDLVLPDSITGWGTATVVIRFSTALTVDGTYSVTIPGGGTITDAAGNPPAHGADRTVIFTLDTVAPAVPAAPDLQAASDSGVDNSDNLTNDTTPTFDLAGAPCFRFYRDGVPISGGAQPGTGYTTPPQFDFCTLGGHGNRVF